MHLLYPAYRTLVSHRDSTSGRNNVVIEVCTSFRLKPLDIEFMRRLHNKVNLIPVIAKADTLTDDEVSAFKRRVRRPDFGQITRTSELTKSYRARSRSWMTSTITGFRSSSLLSTRTKMRRRSRRTKRSWYVSRIGQAEVLCALS